MKKLLSIALLFIVCSAAFGQKRGTVLLMPDSTTDFGITIPVNSLVFDFSANRLWKITAFADASTDIQNAAKELITETGAGAQTLAEVLTLGNSAGANDILLKGNAAKFGSTDAIEITENAAVLRIWNTDITGTGAIHNKIISGASNNSNYFAIGQHGWQQTGVGTTGQFIIDYANEQVPFLTFKDDGVGAVGFKMDIKTAFPFAADRVITFPDLSGTVGLTSQFLDNADITVGAGRTITLTDNLTFTGGELHITTGDNLAGTDAIVIENSDNAILFEQKNDGRFTIGSDRLSTDLLQPAGTVGAINIGQSNGAFSITNAPADGVAVNTTADNLNFNFTTRNSAGNVVAVHKLFVRNRNITAGSEYAVAVYGEAIQTENSDGISGNTVVSTRNRHTNGGASAVLEVENRDDSDVKTTFQVSSFTQSAQLGFAVKSGDAGTTDNVWNWRLKNNHEFEHNFGQLGTGDFIINGTAADVLVVDAGEDAVVVGGSNPDNSAVLDVRSTTKGFLTPRLTTAERDGIVSPATGLIIYNTITNTLQYYNGSIWTNS